jgi:hypothetical protein
MIAACHANTRESANEVPPIRGEPYALTPGFLCNTLDEREKQVGAPHEEKTKATKINYQEIATGAFRPNIQIQKPLSQSFQT